MTPHVLRALAALLVMGATSLSPVHAADALEGKLASSGADKPAAPAIPYTPVTAARLAQPEPGNWLMYRRTYDSWGYSPLKQIDASNVGRLVPLWSFSTGVEEAHQAPPIVNDGVMFISTPKNQVLALDARTGELIWRYRRELPNDLFQLHPTNRGVALWGDKVYLTRRSLVSEDPRKASKSIANEREVEEMFASRGFNIVAPERYSLTEQILAISKATHIAGSTGSALHNAVEGRPLSPGESSAPLLG